MNNLKRFFFIEGILAFGLAALMFYVVGLSNSMLLLSLPFDLLGKGLRSLSLHSVPGNITAIFLYILFSLLPVFYLIYKKIKKNIQTIDVFLPLISIYNFYMIYEFINPLLMLRRVPDLMAVEESIPMTKLSFAITFYALLIGYLILHMLSNLSAVPSADKLNYLCTRLRKILMMISTIYTFTLGYFTTFQMFSDFSQNANEVRTPINSYFIVITYILRGLPIIFAVITILSGVMLLNTMITEHLQEKEVETAEAMGAISKNTVYVTVLCNVSLNLLQFIFSRMLNDTNYNLEISLFPLVIGISAMILSGFFKETKKLYEDNEMII